MNLLVGQRTTARKTSARQGQALAWGWKEIKEFIDSAGEGLRADREKALLLAKERGGR
jgi:hypothetical protein